MELNIEEMRAKVLEREAAREEEFKKHLEADRELESREREKWQALFSKAGERAAAEKRAEMEAEVDTAIEKAEADIKAEYAKKHGVVECDEQMEAFKKMLGGIL